MKINRLIVTGGCGFIGSNFIRYMFNKYPGLKVINVDKLTYSGNENNLLDLKDKNNYNSIQLVKSAIYEINK